MKKATSIQDFKDGMNCTANIDGMNCSGKISFDYNGIFLCQHDKNGTPCNDKKGYKFSWIIYHNTKEFNPAMYSVTNLMIEEINGVECFPDEILLLL